MFTNCSCKFGKHKNSRLICKKINQHGKKYDACKFRMEWQAKF